MCLQSPAPPSGLHASLGVAGAGAYAGHPAAAALMQQQQQAAQQQQHRRQHQRQVAQQAAIQQMMAGETILCRWHPRV